MKVCGVELKNNEAVFCFLAKKDGLFDIPDTKRQRLTLQQVESREHLRNFQSQFAEIMAEHGVQKVVIKERAMKGKFAGGAVGFKLEAAIQLLDDLEVELISPHQIKQAIKENPLSIEFSETGLKAFQENAFLTAYASIA